MPLAFAPAFSTLCARSLHGAGSVSQLQQCLSWWEQLSLLQELVVVQPGRPHSALVHPHILWVYVELSLHPSHVSALPQGGSGSVKEESHH